jgi:hypothetical protein
VNSTAEGIGVGRIDGVGVEAGVAAGVADGTEMGEVVGEGDGLSVAPAEADVDGPVTADGEAEGDGPMFRNTRAAMTTTIPAARRPKAGRHCVRAVEADGFAAAESSARATRVSRPAGGSPPIDR